jgi:16S rRNA (uracil1498-N3)-methyltransferase
VNLLILEPGESGDGSDTRVSGARAEHLLNVLRVEPGAEVRVGILNGPRGVGTVTALDADARTVTLRCRFDAALPARPKVDILLALPRPKVLRRLWAQLAALGVGRIILTNAERVERNYFDTHILSPEYYKPLLIEGLQQARDTWLPAVSVHRQFKVLVEDELDSLFTRGRRLVADPSGTEAPRGVNGDRTLLAVGPEGGWNDYELRLLDTRGFRRVGMGARTLRTDTACIALLALVSALE